MIVNRRLVGSSLKHLVEMFVLALTMDGYHANFAGGSEVLAEYLPNYFFILFRKPFCRCMSWWNNSIIFNHQMIDGV